MLSIVLNIDETPTTRPDSITMFGCPEVISGAQNSQIVSTNWITTNDNNNRPALVSYSIVNGLLPTGLILSSDTGIISGTPTINSDGSFQIKAMGVTGSLWENLEAFSSTINYNISLPNPTQLIMSNLPSLIKGLQYVPITNTGLITTTDNNGADATVTYSVDDNLPLGLSINEATGVISGRPTSLGSGTFTITATGTGNWANLNNTSIISYAIVSNNIKLNIVGITQLLIPFKTTYTYETNIPNATIVANNLPDDFMFDGHTLRTPDTVASAGRFSLTAIFANLTYTTEICYYPDTITFEDNRVILIEGNPDYYRIEQIAPSNSNAMSFTLTDGQKRYTTGVYFKNINSNVSSIDDYFLYQCSALSSVDLSSLSGINSIGNNFLAYSSRIANIDLNPLNGISSIGTHFLTYCSGLISIDLTPLRGLSIINDHFLSNCSKLTAIDLSPLSNISGSVGSYFLAYCSALTSIDLSPLSGLNSVGDRFLYYCSALTSIDLNPLSSVNSIGTYFLSGCSGLTSIDLTPLSGLSIINDRFLSICTGLTAIDLSPLSMVSVIRNYFLSGCSKLTSIDLSPLSMVNNIGSNFLSECSKLASVDLKSFSMCTIVGSNFLSYCTGLMYIGVGDVDWSTKDMGANALNAVENIPLNIVYGTKAQEFKNRFNNISDWSVVIP